MDNQPMNKFAPGMYPYMNAPRVVPFSKQELNSFRHKGEKPLYYTLVVINVLVILSALICVVAAVAGHGPFVGEMGEQISKELMGEDVSSRYLYVEVLMLLAGIPLLLMAMVYLYYAEYRANAIRITPKNFPEIYEVVEEYAQRLGMKETPKIYLSQANGVLNAFSAYILRRQYIVLYTDLFEVAYLEHHDLDSIKFIIGHEMAHIRLRHATFGYQMTILFGNYFPILSTALSRAREYSCDRVAQHLTGMSGVEPMLALVVGKHLYKKVDVEDYVQHCHEVRGFFVFIYNLMATHPIMPKRVQALLRDHGSGRLFF